MVPGYAALDWSSGLYESIVGCTGRESSTDETSVLALVPVGCPEA